MKILTLVEIQGRYINRLTERTQQWPNAKRNVLVFSCWIRSRAHCQKKNEDPELINFPRSSCTSFIGRPRPRICNAVEGL